MGGVSNALKNECITYIVPFCITNLFSYLFAKQYFLESIIYVVVVFLQSSHS